MEVAQEQQDALLYKGFLVPPVLGDAITEEVHDNQSSIQDVRAGIEKLSQTRILKKHRVEALLRNEDDADFVYVQQKDDDQFLQHEAIMFRFAEFVRKFIIESKYLKDESSLWPYYKNYSHKSNFQTYHTLVNRFNLTFLVGKSNIFQLFEQDEENESSTCLDHFSCFQACCNKYCGGSQSNEQSEPEIAIRHRRKYAATLLLQKWDTLRNLNILRQQLIVIFSSPLMEVEFERHVDEDTKIYRIKAEFDNGKKIAFLDEEKTFEIDEEVSQQADMVKKASYFKKEIWKKQIEIMNEKLRKNIKSKTNGWQFLSEYNLKDNKPIDITIKQYPFFESFCKHFLFKSVKKTRKELGKDITPPPWYSQFKQTWIATPEWWSRKHDLILLELALKHNINHAKYLNELKGEKAFDFRMRLKNRTTYLEFEHWCEQLANILHRLKFITNIIIDNLNEINPSIVQIRIPNIGKQEKHGLIFSKTEKQTHQEHLDNEHFLPEITKYKPASKIKKGIDDDEHIKYKEIIEPVIHSIITEMNESWPIPVAENKQEEKERDNSANKIGLFIQKSINTLENVKRVRANKNVETEDNLTVTIEMGETKEKTEQKYEYKDNNIIKSEFSEVETKTAELNEDELSESEPEPEPEPEDDNDDEKKKKEVHIVDPFIARDLEVEIYEVINSFDMLRYGKSMTQFVINQIASFDMEQLWVVLGIVMEALPFKMALSILNEEMHILRRGTTEQMEAVCGRMVDGTNWTISSALRMSEYFESIAKEDEFQQDEWMKISQKFEGIAHTHINQIESDHLLYALLSIPLYDTREPMSIIKLALEQKRISFLNNERILSVVKHTWYYGASIDIGEDIKSTDLSFSQMLPILFFYPFRFYMSPIGYNYTLSILFLVYLIYVLLYSFYVVRGTDQQIGYVADLILWLLNIGYVSYEFSEFSDKGREYFSVSGLMNVWDIMISVIWVVLFVINALFLHAFHLHPSDYENIKDLISIDDTNTNIVLMKIYTLLFGLQLFLLSTRFLTLFQNTEYLGGLLKVVQMMFGQIVKFFSVALVTIAAFTFGFFFIYGLETLAQDSELPDSFGNTILFTFDLFIGGGTNDESRVGAVFTVLLTVTGMLILTNLLIALMTTEYEKFQEKAQKEVSFMRIETALDLAHRDRLMPPPLNVIVYPLGLIIHIFTILCAIVPFCGCNLYSRINRTTYVCLDSFYCGCNIDNCQKSRKQRRDIGKDTNDDIILQKQLYNGKWRLFTELTGLMYFYNKTMYQIKKRCKCRCLNKKKKKKKQYRKPEKKYEDSPLTAYHKGCYNCIKLRVKDELQDAKKTEQTTVRGITMKQYITKYEQMHETQLQLADTILLKHLTVDTLFCDYCYQPYIERQVDKSLMGPFRVLLDCISCFVFLFTAYIPLVVLFILMAIIEYLRQCCDDSVKSKKSEQHGDCIEFDREYFPHSDKQLVPP